MHHCGKDQALPQSKHIQPDRTSPQIAGSQRGHPCGFNGSESIMWNRIEGDLDICQKQPIECTLVILNQERRRQIGED